MLFKSRLSGQKWNWSTQFLQYSSQNVKNDQKCPDLPYKYPPLIAQEMMRISKIIVKCHQMSNIT